MIGEIHKAIQSASQTLTLLSKVRCVESYSFPPEYKSKNLYSWPSQFENDSDVISFLKGKNIALGNNYRVKSYPVPYKKYQSYKSIDITEVAKVRLARSLLHVYQVITEKKVVTKITAVWDFAQHPARSYPKSMSDVHGLEEFSKHRDAMLVIDRANEKFSIKLPAFSYRALLAAAAELDHYPIEIEDRSKFVGSSTDKAGRSRRYIVHKGNKEYLLKAINQTIDSIDKLVGNNEWVFILKNDGKKYYYGDK